MVFFLRNKCGASRKIDSKDYQLEPHKAVAEVSKIGNL